MPMYEFHCKDCGFNFEELSSFLVEELPCPKCGYTADKIVSLCSFSLKGDGWYADLYSSTKSKK